VTQPCILHTSACPPPLTLLPHLSHASSHTPLTLLSHSSHTPLTLLSHSSHTPLMPLSHSSHTPLTPLSCPSHTSLMPPLTPLSCSSYTPLSTLCLIGRHCYRPFTYSPIHVLIHPLYCFMCPAFLSAQACKRH
jgi:hypothetical protein